jgi:hypothetical protein
MLEVPSYITQVKIIILQKSAHLFMIFSITFSTLTRAVHSRLAFVFEDILHVTNVIATYAL